MKKKSKDKIVFTRRVCLSEEGIVQYISRKLPESEFRIAEQHIEGCPLCREAVQGSRMFSTPEQYGRGIDILKQKWYNRKLHERKIFSPSTVSILSVAASIILLVGVYLAGDYQRKTRQNYLSGNYQQGTSIDNALKTSNGFLLPFQQVKPTDTHTREILARKSYIRMTYKPELSKIPVTLMNETKIVAGLGAHMEEKLPDTSQKNNKTTSGYLRYPYRVMSMPPPEDAYDVHKEQGSEELLYIVEEMPWFQGKGIQEFNRFVKTNVKYPQQALESRISGRVYVQFTVDEGGQLTNASILKGCHPLLDNEVLRVINNSPPWQPGKQRGKPVKVTMVMPVTFYLYQ